MLSKIWAITWRELYTTFTDRNLILIMILTPLALATIIGAAFSSFLTPGNDVPVSHIPLAVVNLDQGADANGTTINSGDTFLTVLVPEVHRSNDSLDELFDAVKVDDADAARAGVDNGTYTAAIIVPADFSAKLTYSQSHSIEPVSVEVYASPASPISATIVRSVTESIVNQIATGNITVEATIETLIARAQSDPAFGLRFAAASATGSFQPDFSAAFTPSTNPVSIEQETVTGSAVGFNPLVVFGSAQAVFFMLFTAMGNANSLLEEKRDGTLQRLLTSPTPRIVILLGKLIGTFVICMVQVTALIIALTIVGSILSQKDSVYLGQQCAWRGAGDRDSGAGGGGLGDAGRVAGKDAGAGQRHRRRDCAGDGRVRWGVLRDCRLPRFPPADYQADRHLLGGRCLYQTGGKPERHRH